MAVACRLFSGFKSLRLRFILGQINFHGNAALQSAQHAAAFARRHPEVYLCFTPAGPAVFEGESHGVNVSRRL
jgi:hypothetical protein